MSKKKSKKNKSNSYYITVGGIKINLTVLFAAIFLIITITIAEIWNNYRNKILESEKNIVVNAEIIEVGKRHRGGLGLTQTVGYIWFKYYIEDKEFIREYESLDLKNELEKYHIGDCIEILVSQEYDDIYRWNKSKGSFKCKEQDDI